MPRYGYANGGLDGMRHIFQWFTEDVNRIPVRRSKRFYTPRYARGTTSPSTGLEYWVSLQTDRLPGFAVQFDLIDRHREWLYPEPQGSRLSRRSVSLGFAEANGVRTSTVKLSRRNILQLAGSVPFSLDVARLAAQGMATLGVKPSPRSKPSGIPFLVRFTDVAEASGLHAPTVYGGIFRKNYIVETNGLWMRLVRLR